MSFGDKLIKLRKSMKISQEKLAYKLGITRQTLSNWESGITEPDLESAKKISEIFEVSLDELTDNRINILEKKLSSSLEIAKKQMKFTKILFYTVYGVILISLLVIGIKGFLKRDFTTSYQEGFTCKIDNSEYNILLQPGVYDVYDDNLNNYKVTSDGVWTIHVSSKDENGKVLMKDFGLSAGFSLNEAVNSLEDLKKMFLKKGAVCK